MIRPSRCILPAAFCLAVLTGSANAQSRAELLGRLFGDAINCGEDRYEVTRRFEDGQLYLLVEEYGFEEAIQRGALPEPLKSRFMRSLKAALERGRPSRDCTATLRDFGSLVAAARELRERFTQARPQALRARAESLQIDRSDAKASARAILTAHEEKDLFTLSALSTPWNRELIAEIAAEGKGHPRYESLFSGWRWQAIQQWTGAIGEVRYLPNQAMVQFGELGREEVAVVALTWEDGRWWFEDIWSPDRADFERGSRTWPIPPRD